MIIYKATNTVNGKVYIGKTIKTLRLRKSQHLTESKIHRKNYYFYNAINKHGWENFEWEVLCECSSESELTEKEIYFISKYDSYVNGYNSTEGGEGTIGFEHSDEWKEHMKTNNPMHNPETVEKMRATKKESDFFSWDEKFGKERADELREQQSDLMSNNNPMRNPETSKKVQESKQGYYNSEKYIQDRKRVADSIAKSISKDWTIITPEGDEVDITNLNGYCKENNLNAACMHSVAVGKRKQHKGYKCRRRE